MSILNRLERKAPQTERPSVAKRSTGFSAAAINRLTAGLSQSSRAVNADLDSALVILRSRARYLCANNEFGRRFLSLVANNVVGPRGPSLQVRRYDRNGGLDKPVNDTVETHWARWGKRCDVTGRLSLAALLRIAIRSVARDGEALIRVVHGRAYSYGFALQVLEVDRLNESLNRIEPNGNVTRMGVEMDDRMCPVAYWIYERHPGENWHAGGPRQMERVPAKDIFHLFTQERAEQVRGYTWLHAVLNRANMLAGYEEAAITAARVGASKMGVITRSIESGTDRPNDIADGEDPTTGALQMSAEPGEFFDFTSMPGVDITSWDPEYPHQNFDSFLKACIRGWATGVDVATHNLSGDMTDVNYSSARIAELNERDAWLTAQDWLIGAFIEPIYQEWLNTALLRGDITFEKSGKRMPETLWREIVNASRFQGRRWSWVDPLKEAQAARELIAAGLASRTEIAASMGREFDDIVDELGQENKIMEEKNIKPQAAQPAGKPPTSDEDDGVSDET